MPSMPSGRLGERRPRPAMLWNRLRREERHIVLKATRRDSNKRNPLAIDCRISERRAFRVS